jgi:hypothetical protein
VKKATVQGFLVAILLATPVSAEVTLPELAPDTNYSRMQLDHLAVPRMNAVLDQIRGLRGLTPRSDALVVMANEHRSALVTELDDAKSPNRRLLLFFFPDSSESFFLQLQLNAEAVPEMRLWSAGPSELVIAGDQMQLLEQPSNDTFRLPRIVTGTADHGVTTDALSITDTIACIARSLGIGLDSTSLTTRLSSALCSATSTISLALTACSCLSIAGLGSNLVFATIGCITGITKLLSCGFVNCNASSCAVATIYFNAPVSSSWSSTCGSTHRGDRYAKFYSFLLTSTTTVIIDLSSSTVDTYLYLLQGSGTGGSVITYDDDSGPGTDSRIVRTLGPGSYTIEATTYNSGRTGSFGLSVR